MNVKAWIVLLFVGALVGCAGGGTITEQDELYDHYVRMDRDGAPRNVLNGLKHEDVGEFKKLQLNNIVEKISDHVKKFKNDSRIVVYLHGAPLFGDVTISETRETLKLMRSENDRWYPLVVNWEGSLVDVYEDHLFRVRQGRKVNAFYGFFTAPVVAASDFLISFGRALPTWITVSNHILDTEFPVLDRDGRTEADIRQGVALTASGSNMKVDSQNHNGKVEGIQVADVGDKEVPKADLKLEGECPPVNLSSVTPAVPEYTADTLARFPVDAVRTAPAFVVYPFAASYGSSMWKNYNRRAQSAIRQPREFEGRYSERDGKDDSASGTLAVLMSEIEGIDGIRDHGAKVILIGHSTGALIIANFVSTYVGGVNGGNKESDGEDASPTPQLQIDKIVFLGAAATINDFNRTIVPYLKENADANFYNISLNAYREAKSSFLGLRTPSLLEWLDMFVARPASHADRVIGKWENVMLAMHSIPCGVRNQVHLKHLPGGKEYPQHHRDLDNRSSKYNPFDEDQWEVVTGR